MIDVSNFEQQVIEASYEKPVLVDFWAPWCGPCRQLGPILEKLDEEDESFTLAKLNTDEDQTTAMRYNIRSIPAVKLFVDGEVADEFLGAIPEPQVRRWLKEALPSETKQLFDDAAALLEAGDTDGAESKLEQVLAMEPGNADAAMSLANVIVFRDPVRALELAKAASHADAAKYQEAQGIETIVELLGRRDAADALPDDPAKAPYVQALAELGKGDLDAALSAFIDSVRLNRHYNNDAARKAALALFQVLGTRNPLTQKHQRALGMALF
ncbi:MAG TPA: thioredoxin [Dehalococcoidia bacterium]|jgi:putative thioredoxin|nr:thioredoxin [Dehalococcoidia bacterium]